ncbi:hypothetical protein [Microbulbifer discodermiae]|uniref:hypothetical protein n=1 Tax=Microbulbifer sp. 2201CG32-9 TaxID=3232309 RepID=UPI00345C2977
MSNENLPELLSSQPDVALVKLAKFDHNVRSDTLMRFAANRLETVMRNKRKIDQGAGLESTQEIDNQSELLSKKLIWAWMKDPSLALAVRKALEIYPSTELAEPVFNAIFRRCSFHCTSTHDEVTSATADYLMADVFRCCIELNGYFQRVEFPRNTSPDQLLQLACHYAQKTMASAKVPVFLQRQALLLLAVKQKPTSFPKSQNLLHHKLHLILSGKTPSWNRQFLALYEVAAQITGMPDSIANLLVESAESLDSKKQEELLVDLGPVNTNFDKICVYGNHKIAIQNYRTPAAFTAR